MKKAFAEELERTKNEDRQPEEPLIGAQRLLLTGYWEWDLQTRKYSWCEEMYRILNLPPQESPPRTGTFFNCVHPEDREKVAGALGKALAGGQPLDIEHRIIWPDGSVRIMLAKAEVTFDQGRPVRVLGSIQDITEQRQVQAT